jgi:RNA polymerase sigma-70 factor (ECF subfamily)
VSTTRDRPSLEPSDETLADRARGGCGVSFATLVHRHESVVYRLALRLSGHHHDAEDISQETFFRAHRAMASFRGQSRFCTWLCKIAVHAAFMRKRAEKHHPTVGFEEEEMPAHAPLADDVLEYKYRVRLAAEAVASLEARQRTAFTLCFLEGMPSSEVAAMLGASGPALRQCAHRARNNVREHVRVHLAG